MKNYKVKILETYAYEIEVEATSSKGALSKAKEIYNNIDSGYVFVADATTIESTRFKLIK